jgi:acyl carrier protein
VTSIDIPRPFLDILKAHLPYAGSGDLAATDDLSALGLDSMGVVRLLVDLEERYGLDLPDELLTEETFATPGSLWETVAGLVAVERAAGD